MRLALREKFPGVKFSVRSKTYSGGASIDVDWTDGPTAKRVEVVAGRFAGADFDGMRDLKTYHDSRFGGERVHFGADFVFCNRAYSRALLEAAARRVAERYGVPVVDVRDGLGDAYLVPTQPEPMVGNEWLSIAVLRDAGEKPGPIG